MKGSMKAFVFLVSFVGHDTTAIAAESSRVKTPTSAEDKHADNRRNLISLAEMWRIGDPTFVSDGLNLVLKYPLSTFVDQNMAHYEVYDVNCWEGGVVVSTESVIRSPLLDVAPGSVTDAANFSLDGKTATVELAIDSSNIASDDDVYSETITPTTKRATIAFCVRFGLNIPGEESPTEVNFSETIVEINLNLSSGFAVDDAIVSEKNRAVQTATKSYKVNGYLCEAGTSNQRLVEDGTTKPHTQGTMVTVCVEPDPDAASDGIVMRSIDYFEWNKGSINQPAIESGTASNHLTTFDAIDCEGGTYCKFSSLLFAAFYNNNEGVEVRGSGIALLQFASADSRIRMRGLRKGKIKEDQQHQHRGLQQGATATSDFYVKFSARAGYDSRPPLARSNYMGGMTGNGIFTGRKLAALACILVAIAGIAAVVKFWWR